MVKNLRCNESCNLRLKVNVMQGIPNVNEEQKEPLASRTVNFEL